ncbi:hypothetical protein CK203_117311 [Vitis vinifera]|uniref:Retrotransposon Copia-like N-terminal domain-containing protein n=1 Tax=Vitis vinifera TaxID=29760 RepID=A0A438D6V3_VITVI|nr:hypothetical protein CK203_117311 [Vitis vinifera]
MDSWMDPSNNRTTIHQNLKIGGPSIQCLSHGCLAPLNPHFDQPYLTWKTKKEAIHEFYSASCGRNPGGDGKDKTVICSICKRKGHEADSCFQRIGYPKWWGDKPRTTTSGRSGGRGMWCSSRVQVEDEGVKGLLEPMQFKRQELMVGEVL